MGPSDREERNVSSVSVQYVPELTIQKKALSDFLQISSHLISTSFSLQLKYVYHFNVLQLILPPCDVSVNHFPTEERQSLELVVTFKY